MDNLKIEKKLQDKIDETLSSNVFNLIEEQKILLQEMFKTVFLHGVNDGLALGQKIIEEALKAKTKTHV